jgi:hypothetical protein
MPCVFPAGGTPPSELKRGEGVAPRAYKLTPVASDARSHGVARKLDNPMSDYATTRDELFGKGKATDETRDALEKRAEFRQLVLTRATIRINAALFYDYCVLEHESAVGN